MHFSFNTTFIFNIHLLSTLTLFGTPVHLIIAAGCAGFRCYSIVNLSIKADDYAVNSPHLVLGSELVADLKAKTKSSTPCSSPGTGLPTPALG